MLICAPLPHAFAQESLQFQPVTPKLLPQTWLKLAEMGFNITEAMKTRFTAEKDTFITLFPPNESVPEALMLYGLGADFTQEGFQLIFRRIVKQQKTKVKQLYIQIDDFPFPIDLAEPKGKAFLQGALCDALLGNYELDQLKSESKKPSLLSQIILLTDEQHLSEIQELVHRVRIIANAEQITMHLIDLPANYLNPEQFAQKAHALGTENGLAVQYFSLSEIKEMGMGGLVGVNQGSEIGATFSVMHHRPKQQPAPLKVALVGKGVTFDTGGISIKPAENMHLMKCDMSGAAVVFGVLIAASLLELPIEVVGFIPATENKTGAKALLPSDVITMYNGKTVEVEDTDAEGRLILADALAYAVRNHKPDHLIDLATLTGSCVVALGYEAAGLFSNQPNLVDALYQSAENTAQRVWQLPLWEVYKSQLHSDVADLKNLGGRGGGAITAAKFLEQFTDEHPSYAHLDIAGVSFRDSEFTKMRAATGWGVRLLLDYLLNLSSKPAV